MNKGLEIVVVLEGGVAQAVIVRPEDIERVRALGIEVTVIDYDVDEDDATAYVPQDDGVLAPAWVYGFAPSASDIDLDAIIDKDDLDEDEDLLDVLEEVE